MQGTGEHFGACNLQPRGLGSNKPRSQMHLQTCCVKFLQENQTDPVAQPIWQKTRGQRMNFNVRWVGLKSSQGHWWGRFGGRTFGKFAWWFPSKLICLGLMIFFFYTGNFPSCWSRTLFQMLANTARAQQPSDFRPIANIPLLYKTFAFMILGRMEGLLEAHQPEEQHGFRKHRRMDEHLLTATLFLDKAWDKGIPVWIVSLNLSKALDRANENALWLALRDHGVSDHLIWILQWIYSNQLGEVQGEHSNSNPFPIHAGVRQGCVLRPGLFCSVLQWGMSAWIQNAEARTCGFDLGDNMAFLLDLRFADDILLCARTRCKTNGSIGRSGTQIAAHRVAIEHRKNSCFNFRGATAIFFAIPTMDVNYEFCSNRRHTNGLVAWSVLRDQETRNWIFNIVFRLHQGLSTLTRGYCVTKACLLYIDSATSKRLSPQLLALVHHTVILPNWTWNIVDWCAWLWAPLQTLIGHHPGTRSTKYRWCRTTLDWNLGLSHASRQCGSSLLMLQPCPRNVGPAGFLNGTSEDHGNEEDLLTLGRQRCKDIPSGKAVAIGLWRLLRTIIRCGRYRILCFSRCYTSWFG